MKRKRTSNRAKSNRINKTRTKRLKLRPSSNKTLGNRRIRITPKITTFRRNTILTKSGLNSQNKTNRLKTLIIKPKNLIIITSPV